jgi:acyl carrier protein
VTRTSDARTMAAPDELIDQLRTLILEASPEPSRASAVMTCGPDAHLDDLMPFSSIIVLGTIVAVEEAFRIRIMRQELFGAFEGGVTLRKLATLIEGKRDGNGRA